MKSIAILLVLYLMLAGLHWGFWHEFRDAGLLSLSLSLSAVSGALAYVFTRGFMLRAKEKSSGLQNVASDVAQRDSHPHGLLYSALVSILGIALGGLMDGSGAAILIGLHVFLGATCGFMTYLFLRVNEYSPESPS